MGRKQVAREEKPFLVMVGQAQAARRLAHVKRILPAHSPNLPVPVPTSPSPSSSMCAASASSSSASASTHAGPRARILCLHGYENSKEIMHKQMRMAGWLGSGRKSDEKVVPFENCDFVFVSAPFASEPPVSKIVEHFFPEDPKRQWFERIQNEEAGVRYLGLDVGLKHIEDALEKEGPPDGIFGFSQGAGLSLVVAAKQQQGEMLGNNPPLKFAIVIAGFRARDMTLSNLFEEKLVCPTLHIWGDQDILRYKSEEVTEYCTDPIILRHKAGHKIPHVNTIDCTKIESFINNLL